MEDVKLSINGDKEAYLRLINQHKLSLYKVAKSILNNESDIEDAFQETIVKAYCSIKKLNDSNYFKTWIIRIMINECNTIIRKNKKFLLTPTEENTPYTDMDLDRVELMDLINTLDKDLRIVIVLYYVEDISCKDISKILKISESAVRTRLFRAREKLKNIFVI